MKDTITINDQEIKMIKKGKIISIIVKRDTHQMNHQAILLHLLWMVRTLKSTRVVDVGKILREETPLHFSLSLSDQW